MAGADDGLPENEANEQQAAAIALGEEDQNVLDYMCQELTSRPHLALPLAQFMIPDLTFAPSKSLTAKRFEGQIGFIHGSKGFAFIESPEAKEHFNGADVFLHTAQRGAYQTGANVSFAILMNKDGKPQAFDLDQANGSGKGSAKGIQGKGSGKEHWQGAAGSAWPQKLKLPAVQAHTPSYNQDGSRHFGTIHVFTPGTFGFIKCDATYSVYGHDVWVHHQQVGNFAVGDEVTFTLILNKDGKPQAIDLEPAANSGYAAAKGSGAKGWKDGAKGWKDGWKAKGPVAVPTVVDTPSKKRPFSEMDGSGERHNGQIASFYPQKGYGFIACPELQPIYGVDVWTHSAQIGSFQVGDAVSFTLQIGKAGKPQAFDLAPVES